MNLGIQKTVLAVLGLGLAITSTGCMTSPGHGEHIGNFEGNVSFGGYLLDPDSWIQIQAKHPTEGWKTIGWTKSKNWSIPYSGDDWHPWNASIKIPSAYWTFLGFGNPNGHFRAQVRAVQYSTGNSLVTFKAGFGDYFDYSTPVADMWIENGHGNEATIFGNAYIP